MSAKASKPSTAVLPKKVAKKPAVAGPSVKKSKKNYKSFKTYISKILKQVHPDTGMRESSLLIVNEMIVNLAIQIILKIKLCMLASKVQTASSRIVQAAIRIVLPGELAKHAISEGTKAVTKFNAMEKGSHKKGTGASELAGLTFPVPRTRTLLREHLGGRIGNGAPIYLAAVLEYMVAEILELAGNASRDYRKHNIIPRHITLAIGNDEELSQVFSTCVIGGGVLPHIEAALIPKSGKSKKE